VQHKPAHGLICKTLLGLAMLACESEQPAPKEALPPSTVELSSTEHLLRISTSLRGRRPSAAELHAVRNDPRTLGSIVDEYLKSPEFGETVRELHNEALQVRVAAGIYPAGFPARAALASYDAQAVNVAVTEAPLRLIQWVIEHDGPYTEIVTANYTIADETVASVWGIALEGSGSGWQKGQFEDGRPHAGILSDSMLFTRHSTTYSNSNRGRANAVARSLLCYDFLERDITVDATINLADPKEVANAVRTNSACASCHQTLDPLASYFGAFHPIYVPSDITSYPFKHYLPALSAAFTTSEPAYFGHKGEGLVFLGSMIAQDPRFALCTTQRFFAYLNQSRVEDVPIERSTELYRVFVESGFSAKALVREIVLSAEFRQSHAILDGSADDPNGLHKIRPGQLARLIQDITGYRWTTYLGIDIGSGPIGTLDLLNDSLFGFEVLLGGIDSVNVTLPAHTMTASASLVLRGLAARASAYVVEQDFAIPRLEQRKLFRLVAETDTDESPLRAQLAELHTLLYGELIEPSDDRVTESYTLFLDALSQSNGDVQRAWKTTLFGMLQDIRMTYF